jgi:hypothetical protein
MTPDEAAAASALLTTAEGVVLPLPDPEPWKYMSEEESEECNVVELSVSG